MYEQDLARTFAFIEWVGAGTIGAVLCRDGNHAEVLPCPHCGAAL